MRIDYAERARSLVGTRFRAQGRGEGELDCVGVVLATFIIPAAEVRRDYSLRGASFDEIRQSIEQFFRQIPKSRQRTGDLLLLAAGPDQPHLAVRTEVGFVHAHAGLRRVVETPGVPEWPLLAVYRKRRGN